MIRTGLEKSGLFYCVARSFFCMAAVMIFLGSVGCSNRVVRKSRTLQPETPEAAASEAVAETEGAGEAIGENGGGVGVPPAEVAIQAASEGADGADILQQTRGAVFASLTTPVGAGPPASAVKESPEADPGSQDSITSLTGEDSPPTDSAGAVVTAEGTDEAETPPVEAVTASTPADDSISEEVAEASIAEPTPPPAEEAPTEEAPAEEPVVSAEAEVTRVESPPSATDPPISEASATAKLTTNNLPSDTGSGGRSNTASVLFLVLGGIGAALILIRRRAAA
jgi:hypothetical protein